jgi:hypothetical protein
MIQGAVKPAIQGAIFGALGANNYGAQFHPRQLFTGDALGFVNDPRVALSMYQDTAGLQQTLDGLPVGLMLSQHAPPCEELVANGNFENGSAGWTLDAQWAVVNGKLVATGGGSGTLYAQTPVAVVPGLRYLFRYELEQFTLNGVGTGLSSVFGFSSAAITLKNTVGTHGLAIVASTPAALSLFKSSTSTEGVAVFDNVSVCEVVGPVTQQSSGPSRPIFQPGPARIVFDGMDDAHVTTFPASLGSACTVARAIPGTGAQILTGQTIGTTFTNTVTHAGLVVINRTLTSSETANLTSWLNQAAGV